MLKVPMLVFIYNKCYIVPEANTLLEMSAPSPSKIPRNLRTLSPCPGCQCRVMVMNLKKDLRTSTTAIVQKARPHNYRNITKERKKQHGNGRRFRSHHGRRQRKLLCNHRLESP